MLDLEAVATVLHLPPTVDLDSAVQPRGFRLLHKIPRVPEMVSDHVVERFSNLQKIMRASAALALTRVARASSGRPSTAYDRTSSAHPAASSEFVSRRVARLSTMPSIMAALFLSITFSWDEFIIAFLLSRFEVTLPVEIWSMLRSGLNPKTNAIGSLVFLASIVVLVVLELALFGRSRKT